jgi:putative ABC transport system permease protein
VQAAQLNLARTLQSGMRMRRRIWPGLRSGLVVMQVALTLVLMSGAAFFVRGLWQFTSQERGMPMEQMAVIRLDTSAARPSAGDEQRWLLRVAERARQLPGVVSAGLVQSVPFASSWRTRFYIPGRDSEKWGNEGGGRFNFLSNFIDAPAQQSLGLQLRRGRLLSERDVAGAPPVALVNEAFAQAVFPDGSALGRCLHLMKPAAPCTQIVGIVANARMENFYPIEEEQYYLPLAQPVREEVASAALVRFRGAADRELPALSRQVGKDLSGLVLVQSNTVAELAEPQLRPWRLAAATFTSAGLLALLIAFVGLFGVLANQVLQRNREFSIRRILGAANANIGWLVARSLAWLVVPGIAIGLGGAWATEKALNSLLPGSAETVWSPALVSTGVVLAAAALAAWWPVIKATQGETRLVAAEE